MFQEIRQTLGQTEIAQNGQEYQKKTLIVAEVIRVKPAEFSKSGKRGQSLLLDVKGEQEWVKLIGEFEELTATAVGKKYEFLVWPFKPDQSPKSYLYCWIQRQVARDDGSSPTSAASTNADIQAEILAMAERFVQAIEYLILGKQPGDEKPIKDEDIPF